MTYFYLKGECIMNYEINYFFGEEDINEILIEVLLDKISENSCNNHENNLISNCTYFFLQEGGYSV